MTFVAGKHKAKDTSLTNGRTEKWVCL